MRLICAKPYTLIVCQLEALNMHKQMLSLFNMSFLLALITAVNYQFYNALSLTGTSLIYLLVVVIAAFFCDFLVATVIAFLALTMSCG